MLVDAGQADGALAATAALALAGMVGVSDGLSDLFIHFPDYVSCLILL